MSTLVTLGEGLLRLTPAGGDRFTQADAFECHVAGAEVNVAVAASRLGVNATWLSKLPDSPLAERITGELERHGVYPVVTESEDGRVGTYYFEPGQPPREPQIIHDRANTAASTYAPEDLPTERVEGASVVHISGVTPALSETLAETTRVALEAAADANTLVSLSIDYREQLLSPEEARETLTDLFEYVDILIAETDEAATVLDIDGSPTERAHALGSRYDCDLTVLTRGEEGALGITGGVVTEQEAYEVTDGYGVGTGDAFVGGFLSRLVKSGGDLPEALEYGAATAALKQTIPGNLALVTAEEVEAVVEKNAAAFPR